MKNRKLTKAALYDAISEQGILLPKIKSSICNMQYLIRVKNCVEYCPKAHEVLDLICMNPPKKMILLYFIQEELSRRGDHLAMQHFTSPSPTPNPTHTRTRTLSQHSHSDT